MKTFPSSVRWIVTNGAAWPPLAAISRAQVSGGRYTSSGNTVIPTGTEIWSVCCAAELVTPELTGTRLGRHVGVRESVEGAERGLCLAHRRASAMVCRSVPGSTSAVTFVTQELTHVLLAGCDIGHERDLQMT